jgi:hypothetical protein
LIPSLNRTYRIFPRATSLKAVDTGLSGFA